MIGSGVFLLPASLAPHGWSAMGGWLVTIAGTLCLAACFSALAQAFPRAGGPYVYVDEAFGRGAAFIVAWSYWLGLWVGNAALAVAAMSNLSAVFPVIGSVPGLGAGLAVAIVATLTTVNLAGARTGSIVAKVTTLLKLLPLIAVIIVAALLLGRNGAAAVVTPPTAMNGGAVMTTVTLTLWAMLGFESATVPADKVSNPSRTIPLATLGGTAATGLLYLGISAAMIALMPADVLAASPSPFADFVRPFVGDVAASLIALFAAIAAIGALNGWIMMAGEMPRAMAVGGVFPGLLARLNGRGAPVNALIASSSLSAVLVLTNYARSLVSLFEFIILISTAAMLVAYVACTAAVLKMRAAGRPIGGRWLGPVAALGLCYAGFAIYAAGREAIGWGALLLLAGVPVLVAMRRGKPLPAA